MDEVSTCLTWFSFLAGAFWFEKAAGSGRATSDRALGKFTAKYDVFVQYQIAKVHNLRREPGLAFAAIQRACEGRNPGLTGLKTDLLYAPIRIDPRYGEWVRKIGFR